MHLLGEIVHQAAFTVPVAGIGVSCATSEPKDPFCGVCHTQKNMVSPAVHTTVSLLMILCIFSTLLLIVCRRLFFSKAALSIPLLA